MFAILLNIILSIPLILIVIYLYLTWNHSYWRKRNVPTVEPLTLFGTFPNIVYQKRNRVFDIDDIYSKYKSLYSAVGVYLTRQPYILILDPKLIHDVLVTNFKSFHDTITSSWVDDPKEDKYVSRNPFWSAGQIWKSKRSEASPGLSQNKIKQAYEIWKDNCEKLQTFLDEKTSKGKTILNTQDVAYRFTIDTMSDFIWGINAGNFQQEEESEIRKVANKWTWYAFTRPNYYDLLTMAPFVRRVYKKRFYPKDTDQFFANVQRDSIEMRKKQGNTNRPDFLNYLLQISERKNLSLDDFTGHSLTVLMDGYDTSGLVLQMAIFFLAKYPEAQTKLRQEIFSAMKENEEENKGRLSFEQITTLPYLDQCVNETLRLFSPIPNFNRICVEPTTLEISPGNVVKIEPGVVATIPTYSLHRDENYFPEPELFKPERFDNAAHLELTKQGIFLPFGDGPRICLGMRVGLLNVKTAVAAIFSRYQVSVCPLTPDENNKNASSFVLVPDGDMLLEYERLNL